MFSTHKTVRVAALGFGVGVLGLLVQACSGVAPASDDEVKVGVSDDVGGVSPKGCDPKDQACPPEGREVQYSKCRPLKIKKAFGEKKVYGNSRLVKYDAINGTVPVLYSDGDKIEGRTLKVDLQSGVSYAETEAGIFLVVGQALTAKGAPGNGKEETPFLVANRVQLDRKSGENFVYCAATGGQDVAGTPAGTELASACVVETPNASWNATGIRSRNYATLEVCTTSNPHPDGLVPSREYPSGSYKVYCYKGEGAALNDLNGTERDPYGYYYPQPEACHVIWWGGYEVPAAKRPSTKSYPAPGVAVATSTLIWRPVAETVPIAN